MDNSPEEEQPSKNIPDNDVSNDSRRRNERLKNTALVFLNEHDPRITDHDVKTEDGIGSFDMKLLDDNDYIMAQRRYFESFYETQEECKRDLQDTVRDYEEDAKHNKTVPSEEMKFKIERIKAVLASMNSTHPATTNNQN